MAIFAVGVGGAEAGAYTQASRDQWLRAYQGHGFPDFLPRLVQSLQE